MFNPFCPQGLQPARLLCSWGFPVKNTGVGTHSLLWGIFLMHGSHPGLLYCRQSLPSEPPAKPDVPYLQLRVSPWLHRFRITFYFSCVDTCVEGARHPQGALGRPNLSVELLNRCAYFFIFLIGQTCLYFESSFFIAI